MLLLLLAVPTMFRYFYERALEGCFYKTRLYNPPISPKSARDLYINDIKIGLVFAGDKLQLFRSVLQFVPALQHK